MDISVVICTRNRPERLTNAVRSCIGQSLLPVEIIIVDDGDLGQDFVARLRDEVQAAGVALVYHHKPLDRRGLTISRNIGWQMARGRVIQFIDDDAELDGDCLKWLAKVFVVDGRGELSGVDFEVREEARTRLGRRVIDQCYQMAGLWRMGSRFTLWRRLPRCLHPFLSDLYPVRDLQGNCMAIPKARLIEVGGFDERLADYAAGEDREISHRLGRTGRLVRISAAKVTHHTDQGGRIDAFRLGFETSFNYLYINRKNATLGMGEWLFFFYTFSVLLMTESIFALAGNRKYHVEQIKGLLSGIRAYAGVIWRNNQGSCS